jgi:polar amino acid transport system substrate-binding protein
MPPRLSQTSGKGQIRRAERSAIDVPPRTATPSLRRRDRPRFATCLLLLVSMLGGFPLAARSETVIERAARTGVITMGGRTDVVPYSFLDRSRQLVGYSIDVAGLIEKEVSRYLNRPVRVEFVPVDDPAKLFAQVSRGEVDLACGTQFTWEREMFVDFSIPYSLSGIRVLTREGRIGGSPESLAGKRLAVVTGSLGEATVRALQPKAVLAPVATLAEGVAQLRAGKVDGVAGDSVILAGTIRAEGAKGYELVPAEGFARYAVGCITAENNSTFVNLMNLAIAQMIQGYVNGDPAATALVNRWLGPNGALDLPPELIKAYFQTVLLTREQIRVSPSPAPAAPTPNR